VLEGGLVRIPAYRSTYDMGTPSRLDTFACLAETYLFARQGIRGHSVGRPSVELAEAMDRAAQLHGITARSVLERPGAEIEDTKHEAALAERRRSSP
jgi:fatty aldehyde-generating acyl-ACP reductase